MSMIQLVKALSDLVDDLKPYFVQKSGDTMTGSLTGTTHGGSWISQASADTPLVITPAVPTDGGRYDGIMRGTFADGSSWVMGGILKRIYFTYFAAGRTANGTDGEIAFDIPNSAILLTRNGYLNTYRTDYNDSTTPSGSMWMDSVVGYDSRGTYSRFNLRQVAFSSTHQGVQLEAHRQINGTDYYNGFYMTINSSGGMAVTINQPAAWRTGMSVLGANNNNGYWGFNRPDGDLNDWIRTSNYGIIPYSSGGASSIGTSSWPFNNGYFKKLSVDGNGAYVKGRYNGSGDDEGVVIGHDSNGWAGCVLGNPSGRRSVFYLASSGNALWRYNNGSSSYNIYHPALNDRVILLTTNASDRLTFMSRGSSDYLHIGSASYGDHGVTWWSSDARMKEDIEDSDVDALSLVLGIRHRSFRMKDTGVEYDIGYVAQELQELDEQLVLGVPNSRIVNGSAVFTGDYRYQVDERKLIPYLSKAVQQVAARNDELETRIAELERKLEGR